MTTYDKYKDSEVEWIGEIPESWEVKKLKYVAETFPSNVDKKSKEDEQEIFLCNYMDVYKNDFITSSIEFMKATASDSQIETFKLNKGDVLATKDSETPDDIAVPALVQEDFENVICGYHLTHIKPNGTFLVGSYLFRLFQSKNYCQYFTTLARGVTRYALNTSAFSELPTIVPSLFEQTAIANYLDTKTTEIDQTIADKEALIVLFEEEKKALINEAVTKGLKPNVKLKPSGVDWLGDIPEHWEVKRLKHLVDIKGRIGFRGYTVADIVNEGEGAITLSPSNIKNQEVTLDNCQYLSWDKYYESPEIQIFDGDIVFVKTGSTIGKVGFFENVGTPMTLNPQLIVFKQIKPLNKFLYFILISQVVEIQNSLNINGGATESLTQDKLGNYFILLPPLQEQIAIVQHIEVETSSINDKINLIKKEIELLKEYRQVLIFEAVTGKIKVAD